MAKQFFKNLISTISKEALVDYYINQNHNQKETCAYFKINSIDILHRILLYYSIEKPKNLIIETIKNTNLNKTEEEKKFRKEKISLKNKGKIISLETKEKISKANKGKKHPSFIKTEESKIKTSKSLKKYYENLSKEERKNRLNYISTYFKEATPEQLENRRLKKLNTLENKSLDKKVATYLKTTNSFGFNPTDEFLHFKYNLEEFESFLKNNKFSYSDLVERFNVTYSSLTNLLESNKLSKYLIKDKSKFESYIGKLLDSWGIHYIQNVRTIISPLELDFYIPDYNIALEFNGTYWHSSLNVDKNYHFNKSKMCSDKKIRLIHIWEYEWNNPEQQEKIKSLLKIALGLTDNKIYARNCIVKEITNKEAKPFNEKNHLQGHRNAQVTYGLFYKEELVQLMSFSKTKYNRNLKEENSWEIIRGCPGSNNIVVGGVSKLFKHFIKEYNPSSVFSYCDFNKFDGKGYEAIGMKFIGYTGPDMKYLINGKVVNREPKKYKENSSNAEALIYGAGSKKYVYDNRR